MNGTKRLEWREALRVFRERMGGLTDAKKSYLKSDRDTRKAVRRRSDSVQDDPELTQQLPSGRERHVVRHGHERYGHIVEAGRAGDYFRTP
jgi:hypothetical protein